MTLSSISVCDWSEGIRKTFYDGGMDELLHPSSGAYRSGHKIFGDKMKAIEMCINRFDKDTKRPSCNSMQP